VWLVVTEERAVRECTIIETALVILNVVTFSSRSVRNIIVVSANESLLVSSTGGRVETVLYDELEASFIDLRTMHKGFNRV
jgi:hypothetical protein